MLRKTLRSALVGLASGCAAVLAASGPALAGAKAQSPTITYRMATTGLDADARGKLQFKPSARRANFRLLAKGLPVGSYSLDLEGTSVATFNVVHNPRAKGGTIGKLNLSQRAGTLSFDPRGHNLQVSQNGSTFLSAHFPMTLSEAMENVEIEAELDNPGVIVGADGEAKFVSKDGRSRFQVDVENLPADTYSLDIDGTVQASIVVDESGEGEIRFDSQPPLLNDDDDQGENDQGENAEADNDSDSSETEEMVLPLTFDPRGTLVQVVRASDGAVVLDVVFPTQPTGENGEENGEKPGRRRLMRG